MRVFYKCVHTIVALLGAMVYFVPLMLALLVCTVVLLRHGLSLSSTFWQELTMYLHSLMILSAVGWAWQQQAHVSIDIFASRFNKAQRAYVTLVTVVLCIWPASALLIYASIPYIAGSIRVMEVSAEAGGLPLVWLHKSMLMIFPVALLMQSLCVLIDAVQDIVSDTMGEDDATQTPAQSELASAPASYPSKLA